MDTVKPTVVRVYLDAETAQDAGKIAGSTNVKLAWLCQQYVQAAVRACKEGGDDHLVLPIRFRLDDHPRPKKAQAA